MSFRVPIFQPGARVSRGGAAVGTTPDAISGLTLWLRSDKGVYSGTSPVTAPTSGSISETGGGFYASGDSVSIRVYSYKDVGGTTYFSTSYYQLDYSFTNDNQSAELGWEYIPAADGYRLIRDFNGSGYINYQDTAGNGLTDDSISNWLANPPAQPDAIYALAADGDAVAKWADQSGSSNHALQGTTSQKPLVGTSNGVRSIQFDDTDDTLETSSFASQSVGTVFVLFNLRAAPTMAAAQYIVDGMGRQVFVKYTDNKYQFQAGGSACNTNVTADTTQQLATCVFAGDASSFVRLNGVLKVTGNCGTAPATTVTFGGAEGGGGKDGGVEIQHVIRYNRVLNAAEITSVENYINTWKADLHPIAGTMFWYKAGVGQYSDAGTTAAVADGLVYRWSDFSDNGYYIEQSSAGIRPQLKTGILNGFPALRWDGTTAQFLATPTSIIPGSLPGLTMFVVCKKLGGTGTRTVIYLSTAAHDFRTAADYPTYHHNVADCIVSTGNTFATGYQGWAARYDDAGNTARVWRTGALVVSAADAGAFGAASQFAIGSRTDGSQKWFGDVVEVLAYPTALNDANMGRVFTYINSKFGV